MLNLRRVYLCEEVSTVGSIHLSRFSSLRFSTSIIVGNLGAPLDLRSWQPDNSRLCLDFEDGDEDKIIFSDDPLVADLLEDKDVESIGSWEESEEL
ncbi:hypothetical protein PHLCEN_2v9254 [Hermanssonia centrifuga]|uniref:Uncharacterized protein n=1 Tax=Hermanssonia centrifuga TaxID=98765 RepID=A0A2R6NS26_9APHY|nr:hypothetical protein PHLCEN_2v9254 [Hermanssonia centrifuga]